MEIGRSLPQSQKLSATTQGNSSPEFTYNLPVSLYFRTTTPIQVDELITSLQSLDKLTARMPKMLGKLSKVKVLRTELLVNEIQAGSIWEDFFVAVVFKDETEMIKFGNYINELAKEHPVETIGSVLVGSLIVFGIYKAIAWAKGDTSKDSYNVEIKDNTIIQIGSDVVNKSPEQFIKLIQTAVGAPKSLAKEAVGVIKPAKEENAEIALGGKELDSPSLNSEFIKAAPSSINIDPEQSSEVLYDVTLDVRKINRDADKGWEAVMPPRITRRVKLSFGDDVSHEDIDGKFEFRADVEVFYKPQGKDKIPTPCEIHLIGLVQD